MLDDATRWQVEPVVSDCAQILGSSRAVHGNLRPYPAPARRHPRTTRASQRGAKESPRTGNPAERDWDEQMGLEGFEGS